MAPTQVIPFFSRGSDALKVFAYSSEDAATALSKAPKYSLPAPRVAAWSNDGNSLALVDQTRGVMVIDLTKEGDGDNMMYHLVGSSKTTQQLYWSPGSTYLVTQHKNASQKDTDPNLHVWRRTGDLIKGYSLEASFLNPKFDKDKILLQWSKDEKSCCRLDASGVLQVLSGSNFTEPLASLPLDHAVGSFAFAPIRPSGALRARMCVFVPDVRDDMQRVVGPAEVAIFDIPQGDSTKTTKKAGVSIESGQQADIEWSPTGTAVLAHCQTEVDETGASYYGGSKLMLISHDGKFRKDLTEVDESISAGTAVQAVNWSPTRDEFVLIRGFQPAAATLWSWDAKAQKCSMIAVLLEKAHRNTIRFNHFGSLVCIAGFGNLAGQVDFFGRGEDESKPFVKVSSCMANCTVSAEWCPDGRKFLTAVLAPRMRVDNGLTVWNALGGDKVAELLFDELTEVQWKPEPEDSLRFLDIPTEEIEKCGREAKEQPAAAGKAKSVYRPPRARGEGANTVAAMMRGEISAPDGMEDRRRNARKSYPRQAEEEANNDDRRGREPSPIPEQGAESGRPRADTEDKKSAAKGGYPGARETGDNATPGPKDMPAKSPPQPPPHSLSAHSAPPSQPPPPPPQQPPMPPPQAVPQAPPSNVGQPPKAAPQRPPNNQQAQQQQQREQQQQAQREQQQREQQAREQQQREQALREQQERERLAREQQQRELQAREQQQRELQTRELQAREAQAREAQARAAQQQQAAQQRAAQQQQQTRGVPPTQAPQRAPVPQQAPQDAPPGYPRQQQMQQQMHGERRPCPRTGWQYVDPRGQAQGPFSLLEMQQWHSMGYFRPDLLMRCDPEDRFTPFHELFPHPMIPFQSYPKRPGGR